MSFSAHNYTSNIIDVFITDDTLAVDLADGRSISVPIEWYPRLVHGTVAERNKWRLIGNGIGISWSELDEDISVQNLLLGQPSAESNRSFKKWLVARQARVHGHDMVAA